ncbi:MAG: glycosyltransferase [Dehalococcoidales bacterium]
MKKRLIVLWAAPERISFPLDVSLSTKYELLSKHVEAHVLVWSDGYKLKTRRLNSTYFYLIPQFRNLFLLRIMLVYPFILYPFTFWLLISKKIDVVLIRPGLQGIISALVKRCSFLFGTSFSLLVEAFGDWIEVPLTSTSKWLRWLYRRFLEMISKFSLTSADMLRAESVSTMNKMRKFAPLKPYSIFPRVHLELFLDLNVKPTTKDSNTFTVLYVGELIKLKGVNHLLTAFQRVYREYSQVKLTIIGDGECRTELARMSEEMGIADNVDFTGFLKPEKVKEHMLKSDVLVLPSMTEGLPRVIIEAMAVGLPIIATDVGSVKELVKDGENGFLVKPMDIDALTKTILNLTGNRERAKKMGSKSQQLVQKAGDLYTMEGYARRYIDTLYKVSKMKHRNN